jgi:Zn-dependent protease
VAIEHECAHAFAAAKLGYSLNKIVLMPFGAVIDLDLRNITLRDEFTVAICGPLCNLATAFFFAAIWWFAPTMYAFTDSAYYASLAIALVNLLPAYPLDGGRIFKFFLQSALSKHPKFTHKSEELSTKIAKLFTLFFSLALLATFVLFALHGKRQFSLLFFALFLFFSVIGNKDKAQYNKLDFTMQNALSRGVELKRVAVLDSCPIKNAFKYITRGSYLVLEVYDEKERHLFDLPQNALSACFAKAQSPYATLGQLCENLTKSSNFP